MPILPGATIGILGGGQLGRMTAMAAREMGYRLRVLDPDPACASRFLVDEHVVAGFDDVAAAEALARGSDVVTIEIEKIGLGALRAAAALAPARPGPDVLGVVQDRAVQKEWIASRGFPVGPFRVARTAAELEVALRELGGPAFVKAARGGYDGRGQVEVAAPTEAAAAFRDLGGGPCVAEAALAIDREISVMVARRPSGEVMAYPPALNHHESRILAWSVLPAPIPVAMASGAEEIARGISGAIGLEGLLCVEIFVVGGELLVNELAPRPHNSYHASVLACRTSQFEQHVRATCDLPLGSTRVVQPAAIANLLGDLWRGGAPPPFDQALALPGVRLHLYGKAEARPGRKMGHLSAAAETPEAAVELVQRATAALLGSTR